MVPDLPDLEFSSGGWSHRRLMSFWGLEMSLASTGPMTQFQAYM